MTDKQKLINYVGKFTSGDQLKTTIIVQTDQSQLILSIDSSNIYKSQKVLLKHRINT